LKVSAVAALAGAVIELASKRLEDNFTIPLLSAAAAAAVL
jgi:dolichol kinase